MLFTVELVWKVARYTSAGPTYFSECDDYIDGGVLANNPSMAAWVEINNYHEVMVRGIFPQGLVLIKADN